MSLYTIVEASSLAELQEAVRALVEPRDGWTCLGGPFTYPWSGGHGPIHAFTADHPQRDMIFVAICQALTRSAP